MVGTHEVEHTEETLATEPPLADVQVVPATERKPKVQPRNQKFKKKGENSGVGEATHCEDCSMWLPVKMSKKQPFPKSVIEAIGEKAPNTISYM